MRIVTNLFSALFFFAGTLAVILGILSASNSNLFSASAVQITQVYTQASHSVLVGIGFLLTSMILQLTLIIRGQQATAKEMKQANKALTYLARQAIQNQTQKS